MQCSPATERAECARAALLRPLVRLLCLCAIALAAWTAAAAAAAADTAADRAESVLGGAAQVAGQADGAEHAEPPEHTPDPPEDAPQPPTPAPGAEGAVGDGVAAVTGAVAETGAPDTVRGVVGAAASGGEAPRPAADLVEHAGSAVRAVGTAAAETAPPRGAGSADLGAVRLGSAVDALGAVADPPADPGGTQHHPHQRTAADSDGAQAADHGDERTERPRAERPDRGGAQPRAALQQAAADGTAAQAGDRGSAERPETPAGGERSPHGSAPQTTVQTAPVAHPGHLPSAIAAVPGPVQRLLPADAAGGAVRQAADEAAISPD
ncbi:hypothetical protein [Nocardiopsis coralliicola]